MLKISSYESKELEKAIGITTLKEGGLDVYDLEGQLQQHIPAPPGRNAEDRPGRFNNVEVVYGFKLDGRRVDLAIVSDRGYDQLRIYTINRHRKDILVEVTADHVPFIFSKDQNEVNEKTTAYGLATVKTRKNGETFAFVSRNDKTDIAKLVLYNHKDGSVGYAIADRFKVPEAYNLPDGSQWQPCREKDDELPHVEGMVIDPYREMLYLAQEDVGILKTPIWGPYQPELIDKVREFGVPYSRSWDEEEEEYICQLDDASDPGFGGQHLAADVEGLAIYDAGYGQGYLLASSQEENTFILYDLAGSNPFIADFQITASSTIDGVEETDGAALTSTSLGWNYKGGMLVVQDGHNTPEITNGEGEARDNTNFKWVQWQDIAEPLGLDMGGSNSSRGY